MILSPFVSPQTSKHQEHPLGRLVRHVRGHQRILLGLRRDVYGHPGHLQEGGGRGRVEKRHQDMRCVQRGGGLGLLGGSHGDDRGHACVFPVQLCAPRVGEV